MPAQMQNMANEFWNPVMGAVDMLSQDVLKKRDQARQERLISEQRQYTQEQTSKEREYTQGQEQWKAKMTNLQEMTKDKSLSPESRTAAQQALMKVMTDPKSMVSVQPQYQKGIVPDEVWEYFKSEVAPHGITRETLSPDQAEKMVKAYHEDVRAKAYSSRENRLSTGEVEDKKYLNLQRFGQGVNALEPLERTEVIPPVLDKYGQVTEKGGEKKYYDSKDLERYERAKNVYYDKIRETLGLDPETFLQDVPQVMRAQPQQPQMAYPWMNPQGFEGPDENDPEGLLKILKQRK